MKIKLGSHSIKHYESKGYNIPRNKNKWGRYTIKTGTEIEVDIKDLLPKTNIDVEYECEICKETFHTKYVNLTNNKRFLEEGTTICQKCMFSIVMQGENHPRHVHGSRKYSGYIQNAKKRGYEFNLSIDEFKDITNMKCYYCGGFSNNKNKSNGVDRINNDIGYVKDNCVPCCSICNRMKWAFEYDEFLQHVKNIHDYLKL